MTSLFFQGAMPLFRNILFAALCTAAISGQVHGQAAPAATAPDPYGGFSLPSIGGSLRYSLSAAETLLTGYNGTSGNGVSSYTSLSGNLAYLSHSQRHPFSAVYSGGYLIGNTGFGESTYYQSLSVSQVLQTHHWNFVIADSISYLPQTPVGSLSGIPGAGDLTVAPVQITNQPGLGILTTYATSINNIVSGSASRQLTAGTSLAVSGTYALQRYTGTTTNFSGIDNDQKSGSVSLQHRLNALSSVSVSYSYASSGFQSYLIGSGTHGYQSNSLFGSYSRRINRKLGLYVSAGPQWVPGGTGATTSATSVSVGANAGLNYTAKHFAAGINYSRGINNGNGVVIGSRMDSLTANISRPFGRIFQVGGIVGYNHSTQLGNSILPDYSSSGVVAGGQVSAQLNRSLSAFGSYTVQRQLFSGYAPAGIAFNGLTQYVSFGLTYSPKAFYDRK